MVDGLDFVVAVRYLLGSMNLNFGCSLSHNVEKSSNIFSLFAVRIDTQKKVNSTMINRPMIRVYDFFFKCTWILNYLNTILQPNFVFA